MPGRKMSYRVLYDYTDQYSNRLLQRIGCVLGLTTHLHHHVGRETFATNFIRAGGKVEVLQKLMPMRILRPRCNTCTSVMIESGPKLR